MDLKNNYVVENSQIKMIGTSLTGGKNKEKIINLK